MRTGRAVYAVVEDKLVVGQLETMDTVNGGGTIKTAKDAEAIAVTEFHRVRDYEMAKTIQDMVGLPIGEESHLNPKNKANETVAEPVDFDEESDEENDEDEEGSN